MAVSKAAVAITGDGKKLVLLLKDDALRARMGEAALARGA